MRLLPAIFLAAFCCLLLFTCGCATSGSADEKPLDLGGEPGIGPGGDLEGRWSPWSTDGPQLVRSPVGNWVRNRSLDFLDVFDFSLSSGRWFRAEVDYGIGFYGFGVADCERVRCGRRSVVVDERVREFGTLPFPASAVLYPGYWMTGDARWEAAALGGVANTIEETVWPEPYENGVPREVNRMDVAFMERDRVAQRFKVTPSSVAVGGELHLLLGARAKVYPLEVFDFLAGLVGFDLFDDDIREFKPYDELSGEPEG